LSLFGVQLFKKNDRRVDHHTLYMIDNYVQPSEILTEDFLEKPGHFCGISGIWSPKPINVHKFTFYMLFALQHRGQEACGIAWQNDTRIKTDKALGMVSQRMDSWLTTQELSTCAIGHVRYATHGGSGIINAQPLAIYCNKGHIALAHNGNLSNANELRAELFSQGNIFQTTTDSEIILHRISHSAKTNKIDILKEALAGIEGAFSLCMLWDNELILVRDPQGFRPLYYAQKDDIWYAASETCALYSIGAENIHEVNPGTVIIINNDGIQSFLLDTGKPASLSHCIFELIYFARPDSELFGKSIYAFRKALGEQLAYRDTLTPDIVIPVPDSGTIAAIGYAQAKQCRFELALTRNHYTGRSFILPTKNEREFAVRMKLHPINAIIKDKIVVLIDDSLVRGTTSGIIVKLMREAGAKEVHLRLSSPELKWPCFYGIDIPTREELISHRLSPEAIARTIEADSVQFMSLDDLLLCAGKESCNYCTACFSGKYPTVIS